MKSKDEIEKLLETVGKLWPADGSLVAGAMQKIESTPVSQIAPKKTRIITKSLIAVAVSAIVFAAIWWGVIDSQKSLYAQVMDAVNKARTLHFTACRPTKPGEELVKQGEDWLQRGVGFRVERTISISRPIDAADAGEARQGSAGKKESRLKSGMTRANGLFSRAATSRFGTKATGSIQPPARFSSV